ncbi:MAG: rRNA maturation RNase YbeY [Alphaproteobacteria bacterium]|nr:rRNA maturation RNase YbeY [Alphaproteobacteria bacterium]MBE8220855.1 rRNA maturation RNase YbeY [Alphaproteobacteria bacterium]
MSECVIDIKIETKNWQTHEAALRAHIDYLWDALSLKAGEVSVLLADDTQLAALNKTYRQKETPTNILSFPSLDLAAPYNAALCTRPYLVLGDMAVSFTRVAEEAAMAQLDFRHRALHLITHGLLHLLGYTHDTQLAAHKMETLEATLLAPLGIANPYVNEVLC